MLHCNAPRDNGKGKHPNQTELLSACPVLRFHKATGKTADNILLLFMPSLRFHLSTKVYKLMHLLS